MWCDVSGSGSAASGLMWWLELGMMHHLDQTLIGHLQIGEEEDGKMEPSKKLLQVLRKYRSRM